MTTALASYRDPSHSPEARVADLLGRMTREEKIAQLGSVWGFEIAPGGQVDEDQLARLLGNGLGEVTRIAGSSNLRLRDAARVANAVQRYLVEETRLGIPAIVHEESLHGLLARDAPVFQQSIGAAASFDPGLVEQVAATIRTRMLAMGARHSLAPVLDVTRDPRWGRIEETYGEDPYLAAALGVAYVRGIQGPIPAAGIMATGKHLVGHGLAEGGLNQAPAHVGWRELRDEQLLPFEAAVREAALASVMPAYCDVDGVPCHASRELLVDVLREEWGFDGLVASDYMGIEQLRTQHRMVPELRDAAAAALAAGVDVELPRSVAYAEPLAAAIDDGDVAEELLDAAVARVLAAKMRLGLFEQPYVELPSAEDVEALERTEHRLGRRLAARSMVLLENDGVLPLAPSARLALIGPIADSARDLLGDYSHVLHVETLLEEEQNAMLGAEARGSVALEDELSDRRTILDALRERLGDGAVRYAPGTGVREGTDEELAAAVDLARDADVALLVLGERSGLTPDSTTGEFRDRVGLGLLGRQQELLEAVVGTGTPVVLIVVSGRPLALEWAKDRCAAILLAWVPGDDGPDALVDVLVGDESPGAKLPVSMPRSVGQVPYTYRHRPSGGRSNPRGDHVDSPAGPLWPFGFGRSYTTFELSDLVLERSTIATRDDEVGVSVRVANVGDRVGDEVVQLYLRDEDADVARPVLELCGFARVTLAPGAAAAVRFAVHSEQLSHTGVAYRRIVEPGTVTLSVGTSSADRPLSATLTVTGAVAELRARHRFLTRVDVQPV
jgi:beta-xylosidase